MVPASRSLDIAVIGSGIAGLSAAWLLGQRHRVTLYEAGARLGGHSCTVDAPQADGSRVPVDMGFIVYNEATYPNLTALFEHLGVASRPSDMSFAVSLGGGAFEYAGSDLKGLFAQPSNLASPAFWTMLRDLARFYRTAPGDIAALDRDLTSLGDYLVARRYSRGFIEHHILPQAAAIWSTPAGRVRDYPAAAFLRFCENHGLLQLTGRPQWRTVEGGARAYVERLTARPAPPKRLNVAVQAVRRKPDGLHVRTADGRVTRHDHVVLATHADEALAMIDDAGPRERALLGAFSYSRNLAVLHNDARLMPKRRAAWASWNYVGDADHDRLCVTYWMNRLQGIASDTPLFVTLNPHRTPRPGSIVASEVFTHPIFDARAIRAQRELWSLQGAGNLWFCGAYFGAGFHEDGLQAGLAVAEQLGGVRRPWRVADESGRIHVTPPPAVPELAVAS